MFARKLAPHGLVALAALHPEADLRPDPATRTLVLIGPDGRNFWPIFSNSKEFHDQIPNPLDRWTQRIVTPIAQSLQARVYFPFGQPYQPFFKWALASGRLWQSPVHLLVHESQGLLVSFRAALAFDAKLDLRAKPANAPCETCVGQPCRTACPAKAMLPDRYDTAACHAYLNSEPGLPCMTQGCQVRRACPVGQSNHDPERATFHMAAFHKT